MPLHVRCILCLNKDIEKAVNSSVHLKEATKEEIEAEKTRIEDRVIGEQNYNISSTILGKNLMEDMQLLGQAMLLHLQLVHPKELNRVALLAIHWNGFNVMKFFESKSEEDIFEKEKEQMRDKLVEEVMMFAPDYEEEFEDEDDEEFEDEDEDDENNDLTREDAEEEEEEEDDEEIDSVKKE